MAYTNLIQWNCRGVRPNYNELKLLIDKYCPIVFCLQETYIKADDPLTMRGFSFVDHYASDAGGKATGGTSILIKEGTPHSIIDLDTTLQAKAVSVSLFKTVTICSIYLSPSTPLDTQALDKLVQQLPKPFLLLGDFNAHNVVWGCHDTNNRGNVIDSFIARNGLCLLNNGSFTYMSPATGSLSALDLALCDPSVFLDFQFSVESDTYGSDHYPIILKSNCPQPEGFPRWKFRRADWELFKHLCSTDLTEDILHEADPVAIFSDKLFNIAKQAIPMTTSKPKKVCKPWFNEECRNALNERKKALKKCKEYPTHDNLRCFKIWRAKARRVIRGCKRNSWHNYVGKLNSQTSIKKTWDMIRRISGKHRPGVQHLVQNNTKITALKDIANALGQSFSDNSSAAKYAPKFKIFKKLAEKKKLDFSSDNSEDYNRLFSMAELKRALKRSNDSAPGLDSIHYQLLKHLPNTCLAVLLKIFNFVWETNEFPDSWRKASIIPIPKPGKDHKIATNYRPIALTSCLCKTMERMVNERLIWYLEVNHMITLYQSGFRKNRSTIDHLIRFETFVCESFIRNEHLVSVFFDLEKAYDTTWKFGIMEDLHKLGIRGHMAFFLSDFLMDRSFNVRVGNILSDDFVQEMGVPQGSILSVTLFSLKIYNIVDCLQSGVKCSLYVDDFFNLLFIVQHANH